MDELVNTHGLLAISRPRAGLEIVHFEHRMILDYLLANSVVAKLDARIARPADFFRQLYLNEEGHDARNLDWRPAFSFIAVDRRMQANDFLGLMEAFRDFAKRNSSQVDSISDVLLELLVDGRLNPLDSSLTSDIVEVLFGSNLRSNQIDVLYTLWKSGDSELVRFLLSRYKNACFNGSYLYCLQAGLFSMFDVLDDSEEPPSLAVSQRRAINLLREDGMRGLQMLDVAAWFHKESIPLPQENKMARNVFINLMDDAEGKVHSFAYRAFLEALLPSSNPFNGGQVGKTTEAMRLFGSLAYYSWIDGLPTEFERKLPGLANCGLDIIEGTLNQVITENKEVPSVRYAIKYLAYLALFEQEAQSGSNVLDALHENEDLRECLRFETARLIQEASANRIESDDDYPQAVVFIINAIGASDTPGFAELEAYMFDQVSGDNETPLARNVRRSLVRDNRYAHSERKDQVRARQFVPGETFWCSTTAERGDGKKLARYRVLCAFRDAKEISGATRYAHGIVFEADNGLLRRSPKTNIPLASILLESGLEGNVYLALYHPAILGQHEANKKDPLDDVFIKNLEYSETEVDYFLSVALNRPNLPIIRTRERNFANQDVLEELKFKAIDADGNVIECETLFMFESPETGRNYIVYTDNSVDKEGNTRVYASIYNPEDLKMAGSEDLASLELIPIETDKEWEIIGTILEEMQAQVEDAEVTSTSESVSEEDGNVKGAGQRQVMEVYDTPEALFVAGKYVGAIRRCLRSVDAHPNSLSDKSNLAFLIRYCKIDLRELP
ncbi:MAG: DUF1292 domain-containing protein, partial [Eggerthellaceae bacterium]|nr:DUF1292 domain-containing protein [Eggerthellaceae bacterium]